MRGSHPETNVSIMRKACAAAEVYCVMLTNINEERLNINIFLPEPYEEMIFAVAECTAAPFFLCYFPLLCFL